jgi:hypothetical protein
LLKDVKALGKEYHALTGRPLGCTGEIAEYEAARILGVELSAVRQSGYDAVRHTRDGQQRLQIKGRCILPNAKPGQRIGRIDCSKEWEADRPAVVAALQAPGSRARNERGTLGVSKFKSIGHKIWAR